MTRDFLKRKPLESEGESLINLQGGAYFIVGY